MELREHLINCYKLMLYKIGIQHDIIDKELKNGPILETYSIGDSKFYLYFN